MSAVHRALLRSFRPLAVAALAAGMVACGDDEPSAGGGASEGDAKKSVSVAMQLTLTGVKFAQDTRVGAEQAVKDLAPIKFTINGPPSIDPVLSQKQATDSLAKRPDAVGISPFPPEVWQRTLKTAADQVDHAVTLNAKPVGQPKEAEGASIPTFVGINDTEIARAVARETIKLAKLDARTSGTVLLGQCVAGNSGVLYERIQGFSEIVKELLPETTVKVFDSKVEPQANTETWTQTLRANPEPALAMGTCDQDGTSLYKVKRASKADFPAGAVETPPETIAGIKDGTILASGAVNWWLEGYATVKLLADAARGQGEIPKGFVDVGFTMVTKDNVDAIGLRDSSPAEAEKWYRPKADKFFSELESNVKPLADAWK